MPIENKNYVLRSQLPVELQKTTSFDFVAEDSKIPWQTKNTLRGKAIYLFASITSFGLVPLAAFCLKKLAPKLVLPALNYSDKTKQNEREKKDAYLTWHSLISQSFRLKTSDKAEIDGVLLFRDKNQKKEFQSGQNMQDQKWIVKFNGNAMLYEEKLSDDHQYGQNVGANVLEFNYRGVGESTGTPTKPEDLIRDGETCIQYLLSKGVKEENILIHGLSLGGGVGTQVAAMHDKISMISEKSFSSLSAVVKANFGRVAGALLRGLGWELDSVKVWHKIKNKLIVVHKEDQLMQYKKASLYYLLKKKLMKKHPEQVVQTNSPSGKIKEKLNDSIKPNRIKLSNMVSYGEEDLQDDDPHIIPLKHFPEAMKKVCDFAKKALHIN